MNRIYQGRVTKVEMPNAEGVFDGKEWSEGLEALWEHHALFQDAVNYYVVCLLVLAGDKCSKLRELRERITDAESAGKEGSLYIWDKFRRRGAERLGLRHSVAKYFCPGNEQATWDECAAAVLAGNECAKTNEGRALLDRGLEQLLKKAKGEGGCRDSGKEFLPRFCDPETEATFGEDPARMLRDKQKPRLLRLLHSEGVTHQSKALDEFGVHSIAFVKEGKYLEGAVAATKLKHMIKEWCARKPEAEDDWKRLEEKIKVQISDLKIPEYSGTAAKGDDKFLAYAMCFFRHLDGKSEFAFDLMRSVARKPAEDDDREEAQTVRQDDPIRVARGQRGYVFRGFTSLPEWGGDASGKLGWLRFDVAALTEALKALHQVEEKGIERRAERVRLTQKHLFMRGKIKKLPKAEGKDDASEAQVPVLAGDPRVERLRQLVDVEMREEYEMSEGVPVKYGLQERTIRGLRELRKKWNEKLKPGAVYAEAARMELLDILRDYQKDNPNIVGSVRLFEELLKEPNWIIWRDHDADVMRQWEKDAGVAAGAAFAKDPVQALTDERELIEEIRRLKNPIRLTPADPRDSRRQYYFYDGANRPTKNRLRHNQHHLDAEIAARVEGRLRRSWVRMHFSAPRLMRDQLMAGEGGASSLWQQAMMAALGIRADLTKDGKPATFDKCVAVSLMPEERDDKERRYLLNFPIELDGEATAAQLGKAQRWDANQFGPNFKNSSWLRWPSTPDRNLKNDPWWKCGKPFSCASIDLGQRDAAAFAILEASPGAAPKKQSRELGEAGGKTWWATVKASGMLRLPGEDAKEMRDGKWQEELYGERGRMASDDEWTDAREICDALGLKPDDILGAEPRRHSFPEMNDRLLFALRRAQSRLARLQSWSCVGSEEVKAERRIRIGEQIAEAEDDPLLLKPLVEKQAWELLAAKLINEINDQRAKLPGAMLRIADRIQPLRGRRWEWALRDDASKCHVLRQTLRSTDDRKKLLAGQRGLSIERIEQLESLRRRCQSLNRALMQTPGVPAGLGKGKRGIELPDPCPELLDRLEALKEQRVNQTAHLILAQALGVRLKAHEQDVKLREQRDIHGEYERIPGREPVDFIVLENLDRYLASQGRARSENSRLMKWCHRQILGKLKQLCEPYGLSVLETPAAYSSKFCSLTGVAGFRAMELHPGHSEEFRWRKHLERLADPERMKKLSAEEKTESRRVKALFDALDKWNADIIKAAGPRPMWRTLLAPVTGGPIFVPMKGNPFQADINAAINLGLRAVAAPEAEDIHLRIRAERKGDGFIVRAENIREKAQWDGKPKAIEVLEQKDREKLLADARLNFFRDIGGVADFDHAEIDGKKGYASGRGLWGTINQHDWLRVGEINNHRLEKAGLGRPLDEPDEIKS